MNDHWLKERFKDDSNATLKINMVFATPTEQKDIYAELKRREQETALIQEDTPQ